MRRYWSLGFLTLFSLSLFAVDPSARHVPEPEDVSVIGYITDASRSAARVACEKAVSIDCLQIGSAAQNWIALCQASQSMIKCEERYGGDEILSKRLRNCTAGQYCEDQYLSYAQQAVGCLAGVTNANIGPIIDPLWNNALRNREEQIKFIESCDPSPACRENLAKQSLVFRSFPTEKLKNIPTAQLYVEARETSEIQRVNTRDNKMKNIPLTQPELTPQYANADEEQVMKAGVLWKIVGQSLIERGVQLECFDAMAKAEIICHDLTMLAQAALVVGEVKRIPAASKFVEQVMAKAKVFERRGGGRAASNTMGANREVYAQRNGSFAVAAEQNQQYVNMVTNPEFKGTVGTTQSMVTKKLNSELPKHFVTAMNNREIQIALEEIQKSKILSQVKVTLTNEGAAGGSYGDYKSLFYAVEGNATPEIQAELARVFQVSRERFVRELREQNLLRESDQPQLWFRSAIGENDQYAQAGVEKAHQQMGDSNFTLHTTAETLQPDLDRINRLNAKLSETLGQTPLMEFDPVKNQYTFTKEVYAAIRKTEDPKKVAQTLRLQYPWVTDEQVQNIIYLNKNIKIFNPPNYTIQRHTFDYTVPEAAEGGYSADFLGVGPKVNKATGDAVIGSPDVNAAFIGARAADRKVTDQMNLNRQLIREHIPGAGCSADDCGGFGFVTVQERQRILNALRDQRMDNTRMAFYGKGVVPADRSVLLAHGEDIEKEMRAILMNENVIPAKKLESTGFGMQMLGTKANEGGVSLLIATPDGMAYSPYEMAKIKSALARAIKIKNKGKTPSRYELAD